VRDWRIDIPGNMLRCHLQRLPDTNTVSIFRTVFSGIEIEFAIVTSIRRTGLVILRQFSGREDRRGDQQDAFVAFGCRASVSHPQD
jgi:hypothetical protein